MAKINRFLDEWVKQKLITEAQAKKIIEFENSKVKKPWVLYAFIMLGVSILSIGIISIIASNWKDIPAFAKLLADFILLSAIAFSAYKAGMKNNQLAFDGIAAFFILFYLASIGLISQIYHTGGQLYQALLLLAAVMLPVVLISFRNFIPHLWTVIFLGGIIQYLVLNIDRHYRMNDSFFYFGVLVSLPALCAVLANIFKDRKTADKLAFPFMFWSIIFYSAFVFFLDFNYSIHDRRYTSMFHSDNAADGSIYYLLVNLSCVFFLAAVYFKKSLTLRIRLMAGVLGILFCFMANFFMIFNSYVYVFNKVHEYNYNDYYALYRVIKFIGPAETIASLLVFSFIFSALNYKKLFSLMIILIGIRFVIIYFQVFGSLAYTGFGLIISGLIIIGLVVAWYKFSGRIEKKIGGLMK